MIRVSFDSFVLQGDVVQGPRWSNIMVILYEVMF